VMGAPVSTRHARAWRGHPRLSFVLEKSKTWMPGPRPGMT
jgi:hypothetical protein